MNFLHDAVSVHILRLFNLAVVVAALSDVHTDLVDVIVATIAKIWLLIDVCKAYRETKSEVKLLVLLLK